MSSEARDKSHQNNTVSKSSCRESMKVLRVNYRYPMRLLASFAKHGESFCGDYPMTMSLNPRPQKYTPAPETKETVQSSETDVINAKI